MDETISTLVPSSNRGRYSLDDSETGDDLTSGEQVAILLAGQWIQDHIEHSGSANDSGCYQIADSGRKNKGRPLTEESLKRQVRAAMQECMSLADAMSAASGDVVDLFGGYYFIASDGNVCGLCNSMKVRLL
jgi:hypothetical protein